MYKNNNKLKELAEQEKKDAILRANQLEMFKI